jgi:hypothetical protein
MIDSFISAFPGFTITDRSAVGRGMGHALHCTESCVWDYGKLTGTAKWDDILKLYEIDKQNMLYHMLPNVTHRHLNPSVQSMVKVSLASQAMSSYQHSGHHR